MQSNDEKRIQILQKINALSNSTDKLMLTYPSMYMKTKENLSECETLLAFKPSKAYRYMKKAYLSALKESEAVKNYNSAKEIFQIQNKLGTSEVTLLEHIYLENVADGKLNKALVASRKMIKIANSCPLPKDVSAKIIVDSKGNYSVQVLNNTDKSVIIDRVSASITSGTIEVDFKMATPVQASAQCILPVVINSVGEISIKLAIQYSCNLETFSREYTQVITVPENKQ